MLHVASIRGHAGIPQLIIDQQILAGNGDHIMRVGSLVIGV
jgi:hypothetical protein